MKSKVTKKRLAFILALVLLISGSSVGIFMSFAETSAWEFNNTTEIYMEQRGSLRDEEDDNYESVATQAKLFSSELSAKLGKEEAILISFGSVDTSGQNDIVLRFDPAFDIPEQGYSVSTEKGRLIISASDLDGLYYGCRYVTKQIISNSRRVTTVTNESPDVKERALMLDIGRKYFTVGWIKNMIKEMSWSDMNTLILHFSEEMGLGFGLNNNDEFSWLAGRDGTLCTTEGGDTTDGRFITEEQMIDIINFAKKYHVEIVPSFDSPGHMNYIVKKFITRSAEEIFTFTSCDGETITVDQGTDISNYFHYNGETSLVSGSYNTQYSRGIDISNEIAVEFTRALVKAYAQFFANQGCKKIDLGGDELLGWRNTAVVPVAQVSQWNQLDHWKEYAITRALADRNPNISDIVAYDAFIYYMNDLYDVVSALGYESIRMWSDEALRTHDTGWKEAVKLNENYEIEFWEYNAGNSVNYMKFAELGYNVHNYLKDYCYYILRENATPATVTEQSIYKKWNPYVFNADSSVLDRDHNNAVLHSNKVKGSAFLIWCDVPSLQSEDQIMTNVLPLIRANGAKAWNAVLDTEMTYEQYRVKKNAIGNYPTNLPTAQIYVVPDLTRLKLAIEVFNHVDSRIYTESTYAAYEAEINNCRAVLESRRPTNSQVLQVLADVRAAYNLLELKEVDLSAINSELALYAGFDSSLYTELSFRVYKNKINSAKNMIAKGEYTQSEINDKVSEIVCAKKNLVLADNPESNCIEYAKLRTHDVNHNSVAILGVVNKEGVSVDHYEIVAGEEGEANRTIFKIIKNETKKTNVNDTVGVTYLYFRPTFIGVNVDTVIAYDANDNVIGQYSFTINIV